MLPPSGVEDPISAIFDLSDRVAGMAPVVRRLYRYTAAILILWIVIMAVVALVSLGGAIILSVLAVVGLVVGVIALGLLRQTDAFFTGFVQRYRIIHLVRDAEPVAKIPEGRTPIERLTRYLVESNPDVAATVREDPTAVRFRITLPGRGRLIPFDMVVEKPGRGWARSLGWGEPGFAIVARVTSGPIGLSDLQRLEADVTETLRSFRGLPVRLILLRTQADPLPEDAYEYAVGHPVMVGRSGRRASLEVVTEMPEGSYDFVPHVLGVP